jgi:FMN phosphatase YigB (HAD superfamily)
MSIAAIIFDIGGTLRERVPDKTFQTQAVERLLNLLGKPDASQNYLDELARRYEAYAIWAQENLTESSEQEIWTRWVVPELPRDLVAPHAVARCRAPMRAK